MKNLLPLLPLLLCFTSITQAATGSVALGDLQFTDATATHSDTDAPASQTIDNIKGENSSNGWTTGMDHFDSEHITWTWQNLSAPTLAQGESVAHYTYTINLLCGRANANTYLLRSFSLALGDPANTNTFSTITNYESMSNTQGANGHTMSADTNGFITTTKPNVNNLADTYTLTFKSSTLSNQLRLTTPAVDGSAPGWSDGMGGHIFLLREIEGTATATVVPEPSTYALFLGLSALAYRLIKKKNR